MLALEEVQDTTTYSSHKRGLGKDVQDDTRIYKHLLHEKWLKKKDLNIRYYIL